MSKILSPSMMCANMMNVQHDVEQLEKSGVDWFHLDVMDAHFVPNLTLSPDWCNALRRISKTTFDYHLMMEDPALFVNAAQINAGDYVTIHAEMPKETIEQVATLVKAKAAHFGLALNPETEVEKLEPYLESIDLVLLMLVRPGFAGQKMIEGIMEKVKTTKAYLLEKGKPNILISTDGNITTERAAYMASIGADVFVGGTSAVFKKGQSIEESVRQFRELVK